MKKLFTALLMVAVFATAKAQNTQSLSSFDKITVSPKIELELVAGDQESITWEAFGVDEDQVNIEVKHHRLKIYLDDAKITVKSVKGRYDWTYPMYGKEVLVKAKVTYKSLEKLEVRGEEQINVPGDLQTDKKFILKLYGTSEVRLAGLQVDKFKAVLIGENDLKISSGLTAKQKIKSIGENTVDFSSLRNYETKTSSIGESLIYLNVRDYVKVSAIGESIVQVKGSPMLHKGLIIGENRVSRD